MSGSVPCSLAAHIRACEVKYILRSVQAKVRCRFASPRATLNHQGGIGCCRVRRALHRLCTNPLPSNTPTKSRSDSALLASANGLLRPSPARPHAEPLKQWNPDSRKPTSWRHLLRRLPHLKVTTSSRRIPNLVLSLLQDNSLEASRFKVPAFQLSSMGLDTWHHALNTALDLTVIGSQPS